jgi:hypothetical protein
VGVGGGGGEYVPQMGFGWSNGVALILLQDNSADSVSGSDDDDISVGIKVVVLIVILLTISILATMSYFMYKRFNQPKSVQRNDDINIGILHRDNVKSNLI